MAAVAVVSLEDLEAIVRKVLREELASRAPQGAVLTTEQAAEIAKVEPKTIRMWARKGRLRATRRGRQLRIERADLERATHGDSVDAADILSRLPSGR